MQDLRFAIRSFLKTPAFTALAVSLIALAVAFNASLFSLLYASLLEPLPYPDSGRLVVVLETENGVGDAVLTPANFDDVRRSVKSLEDITGSIRNELELSGVDPPEQITARYVLPGFFDFAGVAPLAGRVLDDGDHQAAARVEDSLYNVADVVVLDYEFWLRRFGGSPDAVGSTVRLNDKAVTIVGVMPKGFDALWRETDVYLPWILPPGFWEERPAHILAMVARLAPGISLERADAEVKTIYARLKDEYPETNTVLSGRVEPFRSFFFGDATEAVLVLQGGALLVLLIACANLAGLMLTRARKRSSELAVRLALGASRARIRRQLLVESSLLALSGGILGIVLAYGILRVARLPVSLQLPFEPRLSAGVVTASVLLLAGTALFLGLVPGALVSRRSLSTSLRGRPFDASASGHGWSTAFSAVQIAFALGLASAGVALVLSLGALQGQELGFEPGNVATFFVTLPDTRYPGEVEQRAFRQSALEELRSIPGVVSVDTASHLPLTPMHINWAIDIVGRPLPRGTLRSAPVFASEGLLRTLGVKLHDGRGFETSDTRDSPWVVVVNETMARVFWPGESAIGKRFRLDYDWMPPGLITVVGVVEDVKQEGLVQDVRPSFYILHEQFPQEWLYFAIRTAGPPVEVLSATRARLKALDPSLPMTDIRTMDERLSGALSEYRSRTGLASLYAGAAVFLAALGLYASLSSLVGQRAREISIRLALGATPRDILGWAMRHGLRPLTVGIPLGLATAWISGRFLQSLLYRVAPSDPVRLVGTTALIAVVALLATLGPAFRAARSLPAAHAKGE